MGEFTIRTRKLVMNPLLMRRQFVVDVLHPKQATIAKKDIREKIAKMYNVKDPQCVMVFGFETKFGGGKMTGFCLIYESMEAMMKYEPTYRLEREGLKEVKRVARKQRKEKKNKQKRVRGTGKIKKKKTN